MQFAEYLSLHNVEMHPPRTKLGKLVAKKLPFDYIFMEDDRAWLDVVDAYVKKYTKAGILQAVQEAVTRHGVTLHCDPYELFIDSKTIKL